MTNLEKGEMPQNQTEMSPKEIAKNEFIAANQAVIELEKQVQSLLTSAVNMEDIKQAKKLHETLNQARQNSLDNLQAWVDEIKKEAGIQTEE
ncbi:MAG: hypothetical protein WC508_00825 [Patescibacteria group bacterium]